MMGFLLYLFANSFIGLALSGGQSCLDCHFFTPEYDIGFRSRMYEVKNRYADNSK